MYLTEDEIEIYENEVLLKEDKEILFEMTNVRKKRTGLPMNIWIDDMGSFRNVKHNIPRIKFQNNTSDNVMGNEIPISIDKENPQILTKKMSINLSSSDINKLKLFIMNNYEGLIKVWKQEIDSIDFVNNEMKPLK